MTTITITATDPSKKKTAIKLLQSAIKREQEILKTGLEKTVRNLKVFEKKYSMTTQRFVELYQSGELNDRNDFIDWAGEYQIYQSLNEQIKVLKEINV